MASITTQQQPHSVLVYPSALRGSAPDNAQQTYTVNNQHFPSLVEPTCTSSLPKASPSHFPGCRTLYRHTTQLNLHNRITGRLPLVCDPTHHTTAGLWGRHANLYSLPRAWYLCIRWVLSSLRRLSPIVPNSTLMSVSGPETRPSPEWAPPPSTHITQHLVCYCLSTDHGKYVAHIHELWLPNSSLMNASELGSRPRKSCTPRDVVSHLKLKLLNVTSP